MQEIEEPDPVLEDTETELDLFRRLAMSFSGEEPNGAQSAKLIEEVDQWLARRPDSLVGK